MLRPKDSVEGPKDRKNHQEFKEDAEEKHAEKDEHEETFHGAKEYLSHTSRPFGSLL
jgi:hypothetical protein